MKTRTFLQTALFTLLPATAMLAQNAENRDSISKFVDLDPIVVTGNGHSQRLKSTTTPVHVINSNVLKESGAASFQDAMTKMMPQLSFSPNTMGSYLRLNGLGNKYVLILINGKKVIGDISGNIDINRIDIGRIQRIEVLDGAASALYGSDAIGGVINIITDQNCDELLSVSAKTQLGGTGKFSEMANIKISAGPLSSVTSFHHDEQNAYQTNNLTYVDEEAGTTQPTVDGIGIGYRSDVISEHLKFDITKRFSIYGEGTFSGKETRRPRLTEGIAGGSAYEIRSKSTRWAAGTNYKLGKSNTLQVDFVSDTYEYGNQYKQESGDFKIDDYSLSKKQRYYDLEAKGIFNFTKGSNTIFGLNWRNDFLKATSGDVDNHVYTMAAYAQHDMNITKNLSATLGVRFTQHETFGSDFTPKFSLMYKAGDFRLRGAYSRGFRAPGLDELYYHYFKLMKGRPVITFGNTGLKAEHSNYFALNAEYTGERFSISILGYINKINDMIIKETVNVDDAIRAELAQSFPEATKEQLAKMTTYGHYINSDKGNIKGIQVNATYNVTPDLSLIANHSYTYARTKTGDVWENLERSVRNTTTLTANYSHSWKNYRLGVNLNARFQSKTFYPAYEDAPGYGIWNLNTTHHFTLTRRLVLEPGLGIENIFNNVDRRIDGSKTRYALYSPGRTLQASLLVKF